MRTPAVEVLNDLILMNNDRIRGYTNTTKSLKDRDADLKIIFKEIIDETRQFNIALAAEVEKLGAAAETHTSVSGKLHLTWIRIKATFTGHNRKALLAECERGEDAIRQAYLEALNESSDLSLDQWELISDQAEKSNLIHNRIKMLRDEAT